MNAKANIPNAISQSVAQRRGGDGAIYAIRRELFRNLDDDDINDFVNPLQIVSAGYRGIFNSHAVCYEDAPQDFRKEYRRKRRIVNRSWRAVKKNLGRFGLFRDFKFLFLLFLFYMLHFILSCKTCQAISGLDNLLTTGVSAGLRFLLQHTFCYLTLIPT